MIDPISSDKFTSTPISLDKVSDGENYLWSDFTQGRNVAETGSAPDAPVQLGQQKIESFASDLKQKTGVDLLAGIDSRALVEAKLGLQSVFGQRDFFNALSGSGEIDNYGNVIDHYNNLKAQNDAVATFDQRMEQLRATNKDSQIRIKTFDELMNEAVAEQIQREQELASTNPENSFTRGLTKMAGGMWGFMTNPAAVATIPFTVGTSVATAFLGNAAVVGTLDAPVESFRAEHGDPNAGLLNGLKTAAIGGVTAVGANLIGKGLSKAASALGDFFSNKFNKGATAALENVKMTANAIDDIAAEVQKVNPKMASGLGYAADQAKVVEHTLSQNPYGSSPEAVIKYEGVLNDMADTLRRGKTLDKVPVWDPYGSPDLPDILIKQVPAGTKEAIQMIKAGTAKKQLGYLREPSFDVAQNELNQLMREGPVRKFTTPSGNYVPVADPNGKITMFNSLTEALDALNATGDKSVKLGGGPNGTYILAKDTHLRELGSFKGPQLADEFIKKQIDSGSFVASDLSVVPVKDTTKVVAYASPEDIKNISNNYDFMKLNAKQNSIPIETTKLQNNPIADYYNNQLNQKVRILNEKPTNIESTPKSPVGQPKPEFLATINEFIDCMRG